MANIACRSLSVEEVAAVATALSKMRNGERNKALFLLGVTTGYRISELLSLRMRDVWDEDGIRPTVTVSKRNIKRKTKGRTMVITDLAAEAILAWLRKAFATWGITPSEYLFSKQSGAPISYQEAWRIIKLGFRRAGIRGAVSTHSMRKTFVSMSREYAVNHPSVGDPLLFAKDMAGHVNVNSTARYLESATQESKSECVTAIASAFEKSLYNSQ